MRKRVSVIRNNAGKYISFVKGSIESILEVSDKQIVHGQIKPIMDDEKQALLQHSEMFAAESLRVIAIAYKELGKSEADKYTIEESETNLVFAGFVTMFDPQEMKFPRQCRMHLMHISAFSLLQAIMKLQPVLLQRI